jgi:hypothetical protein
LLYGLWGQESFVVIGEEWGRQADRELGKLRAITSWADAVRVAHTMNAVPPPFDPDADIREEYEIEDLDDPISWEDLPGVGDGDYPPMPASYTEAWLPRDLLEDNEELASELIETIFNGGYLRISPSQEAELVGSLEARGFELVRDDDLIARIAWA